MFNSVHIKDPMNIVNFHNNDDQPLKSWFGAIEHQDYQKLTLGSYEDCQKTSLTGLVTDCQGWTLA